jgi:pyrroline-5-carboxylate reductase
MTSPLLPTPLRLAVLGTGKMGGALVRGWVEAKAVPGANIRLYDPYHQAASALANDVGASATSSPQQAVQEADVLLLSVKPPLIAPVLQGVRDTLAPSCLIVSIAAGVRLASLEEAAPPNAPVIRVMPNTPALVGEAASAFCRGAHATPAHAAIAQTLFSSVGTIYEVTESQIDAVTGVSGSGVAYFYLLIEALTDGGVRAGLPRDVSRALAAQTALGAARMILETGEHPAVLKDAVTTPGGTTIAALEVLERSGVRGAMIEAVLAAQSRAQEMG